MMENASYSTPEFLVDDVMLMMLKTIYERKDGTIKLAKFEVTNKKASRLVRSHYSANVKKLVIRAPSASNFIALNGCKFVESQGSNYDFDKPPAFLEDLRKCLSYILARVTLISKLITKGWFNYRFAQLEPAIRDLKACPKLLLRTLHLASFWSSYSFNLVIQNSLTLEYLKLRITDDARQKQEKGIKLNLKKLDVDIYSSVSADPENSVAWAMIEGGSHAESVKIRTGRSSNSIVVENKGDIYSQLVQHLSPKSLTWNAVDVACAGFGTVECGNIMDKDSWLEATLNYEIIQDNLRILDLKQGDMWYCTWGLSPFTMSRMKKCFPNLQKLHLTWTALFCPLEKEIENVHKLITDLFTTWPELDATVNFLFMNLGRHAAVINFEQQDMALVENEPNLLQSILPNLALIRTCTRNHRHTQPIFEIISTGKARAILTFVANPLYPGDEEPRGGFAGHSSVKKEDLCSLEEGNGDVEMSSV